MIDPEPSRLAPTGRRLAILAIAIALIAVVAVALVANGYSGLRPASGTAVAMSEATDRAAAERAR